MTALNNRGWDEPLPKICGAIEQTATDKNTRKFNIRVVVNLKTIAFIKK